MNAVMNSPQLRDVYNANLPRITQYFTELAQDEALYRKYKALRASDAFARLTAAQKKVIDNELRDFRLGGAELPAAEKARFKQVIEELAGLSSKFNDNVLDATNAFELVIADKQRLAGIPDDALEFAADAATQAGKQGWKFTLHMPSYLPVMQYAQDRELREQMYHAYVTRAAEFGEPGWDNSRIIVDILRLRRSAWPVSPTFPCSRRWRIRRARCSIFSRNWRSAPGLTRSATSRNSRNLLHVNSGWITCSRGTPPTHRKNCVSNATRFPTRK